MPANQADSRKRFISHAMVTECLKFLSFFPLLIEKFENRTLYELAIHLYKTLNTSLRTNPLSPN